MARRMLSTRSLSSTFWARALSCRSSSWILGMQRRIQSYVEGTIEATKNISNPTVKSFTARQVVTTVGLNVQFIYVERVLKLPLKSPGNFSNDLRLFCWDQELTLKLIIIFFKAISSLTVACCCCCCCCSIHVLLKVL